MSRYRRPKIVSQTERSLSWLRILLLLMMMSFTGWYGYQMGSVGTENGLPVFKTSLREKVKQLEEERKELRRQLTMAKQSAEMDQAAIKAVKEQIKRFQDERLKMEEELAFLRGIVSADSDDSSLRIQKFKLSPDIEEREYNYRFTVSQLINSGVVAKGKIHISLEGIQQGQAMKLELEQLTEGEESSLKMRFRYFQDVEGKLKIPEGFEPARLIIEIRPESKKFNPVTETFDWKPVT